MCGMTRKEDIAHAVFLGVDAIGLIFYPESSRCVTLEQAANLVTEASVFVDVVAVLVNPSVHWVKEIISELPIAYLQFHGEESPEFCMQFKKPYIKAVQVQSTAAIYHCAAEHSQASAILLDTPSKNRGGTGRTFDWKFIPQNLDKPFILAGGLNPTNISAAIDSCLPYAVDVCSGIEVSPGSKDHNKMSQFVDKLWGRE